jgi:molybdate transport system substrate-binding protein
MIKLISSMATREILADLIVRYQTSTSRTVEAEAGGGVDVARRVQEGESFDVVVLAATAIDQLIAAGKLLAGSRVDLVKSGVSIAVRTGAPVPDVSTEDAVRQAVMAARTISYSTGPSGVYLLKLFGACWTRSNRVLSRRLRVYR